MKQLFADAQIGSYNEVTDRISETIGTLNYLISKALTSSDGGNETEQRIIAYLETARMNLKQASTVNRDYRDAEFAWINDLRGPEADGLQIAPWNAEISI